MRGDALGDRAQRELRGLGRGAQLLDGRPELSAQRDLPGECLAAGELVAKLLRGGRDQGAELDGGGGS